ncbi:DNA polymerase III subunit beta [bacterium]|nr:DNA polymerase III subunit beta [bacterium]
MQFVCNRKELEKKTQIVTKIIPSRSTKDSLGSILIRTETPDKLYLYATNIEMSIEALVYCNTDDSQSFLVSAKLFRDIIDSLTSESIIGIMEDKTLNIKAGDTIYHIPTQNLLDFPLPEEFLPEREIFLRSEILKSAVRKVSPFVDKSNVRPVLSGIFIDSREDEVRLVATDANRLAVKKISIEDIGSSVILPALSLETFTSAELDEEIVIDFSNSKVRLRSSGISLVTSIIDGNFPQYERVIPSEFISSVRLDRDVLRESIKRILPISREEDYAVKFSIRKGKLILSAKSHIGVVFDELSVDTDGDEIDVIFSANYITDFLSTDEGMVTLKISGEKDPALFTFDNDPDFIYVTMPMESE